MLEVIDSAADSVYLSTYHFDNDRVGRLFIDALAAARRRGVDVRVIVDAVGMLVSRPSAFAELRRRGVPVLRFGPVWRVTHLNRRYHRKILVADQSEAFLGGMNIRECHLSSSYILDPLRDFVVQVDGVAARALADVFHFDWVHSLGENVGEPTGFHGGQPSSIVGTGPPFPPRCLEKALVVAIREARKRVVILTPYFVLDGVVIEELATACRSGIEVVVVLPRTLARPIQILSRTTVREVSRAGVQVLWTPPPYDHSKLLVIDDHVCVCGSANMDFRSMHWNLEIAICFQDASILGSIIDLVKERISSAGPTPPPALTDIRESKLDRLLQRTLCRLF